jgi:RimJ/RimL family protein N-acetyltransferase
MPVTGREDAQARELTLDDGSIVAVRPVIAADKEAIRSAFARLSPETRYRRFLSLAEALSDEQLRYLTELDHHDHEALIAYEPKTRNGIAVARFVRSPEDPRVAEAAVVVGDDWQGKGLGTALSALLAQRGREEGVQRFDATLLAGNEQILHVIDSLGPSRLLVQEGPTITVEVDISNESLPPHMRGVLRAVARGDAALAPHERSDSDG